MSAEGDIRNAIQNWLDKLAEAVRKRDSLNIEIMQMEQNIRNLNSALFEQTMADQMEQESVIGLSEAIRTVMRRGAVPMSTADVKLALAVAGFDLPRFRNAAAAVANTLERMRIERVGSSTPFPLH